MPDIEYSSNIEKKLKDEDIMNKDNLGESEEKKNYSRDTTLERDKLDEEKGGKKENEENHESSEDSLTESLRKDFDKKIKDNVGSLKDKDGTRISDHANGKLDESTEETKEEERNRTEREKADDVEEKRKSDNIKKLEKKLSVVVGDNLSNKIFSKDSAKKSSVKNGMMREFVKKSGMLFLKKRGPFSKYHQYHVILDEKQSSLNLFKGNSSTEELSSCKLSVDLKFIDFLKAEKPGILRQVYPFKIVRKAGLSTVRLGCTTEVERAEWITAIEDIVQKIRATPVKEVFERSSPLRVSVQDRTTVDCTSIDDELIRPKKVQSGGFKLDSNQISGVKLKRISSQIKEDPEGSNSERDSHDLKEKFGVQLRKVDTENRPARERESSPELEEFKEKYKSLSLTRKHKGPVIPIKEHSIQARALESATDGSRETITVKLKADVADKIEEEKDTGLSPSPKISSDARKRNRSPSPNIPVSRNVEAFIKNSDTGQNVPGEGTTKAKPVIDLQRPSLCHAVSTEITFDEPESLEVLPGKKNSLVQETVDIRPLSGEGKQEGSNIKEDKVESAKEDNSNKKTEDRDSHIEKNKQSPSKQGEGESVRVVKESKLSDDKENKLLDEFIDTKETVISIEFPSKPESTSVETKDTGESDQEIMLIQDEENNNIAETTEATKSFTCSGGNVQYVRVSMHGESEETVKESEETTEQKDSIPSESKTEQGDPKIFLRENTSREDSFVSNNSTESDDPLPRFNFLGRSDRSSCGSVCSEVPADDTAQTPVRHSMGEFIGDTGYLREKTSRGTKGPRRPESWSNKRSSLVGPEFVVLEEPQNEMHEHKNYTNSIQLRFITRSDSYSNEQAFKEHLIEEMKNSENKRVTKESEIKVHEDMRSPAEVECVGQEKTGHGERGERGETLDNTVDKNNVTLDSGEKNESDQGDDMTLNTDGEFVRCDKTEIQLQSENVRENSSVSNSLKTSTDLPNAEICRVKDLEHKTVPKKPRRTSLRTSTSEASCVTETNMNGYDGMKNEEKHEKVSGPCEERAFQRDLRENSFQEKTNENKSMGEENEPSVDTGKDGNSELCTGSRKPPEDNRNSYDVECEENRKKLYKECKQQEKSEQKVAETMPDQGKQTDLEENISTNRGSQVDALSRTSSTDTADSDGTRPTRPSRKRKSKLLESETRL